MGDPMATHSKSETPRPLDLVALTADRPKDCLARGSIGTVLEMLDETTVLVEFDDDLGRASTTAMCTNTELLVLHYAPPQAA
jgi:hypothetical protein